jgi:DHA2 family methylenomycin A resistance protein-like MFS transporter
MSERFPFVFLVAKAKHRSKKLNNTDRPTLAKSLTLAAMSLGYCVVQLDVTIVNTALKSIGASLASGVTAAGCAISTSRK